MHRPTSRKLSTLAALFCIAGCLVGNGCSFNHEWKKAAGNPVPATGIEGRWQGTWVSEVNGHTDALRCVINRKDDGRYRARFHASYHKVLTFGYTVLLTTESTNQESRFQGEANLGWMAGGVYHYAGHAEATNFFSTYACKYDHGTFRMTRP